MSLRPGDIFLAFDGTGNRRPFVVVSREELNRGNYFLAVPFTSTNLSTRQALPNCVFFPRGAFGLSKDCVAQADALTQLRVIDLIQPPVPIGTLSPAVFKQLIVAIGYTLESDCQPT